MTENPIFPTLLMRETADPLEVAQVLVAMIGFVMSCWLLWLAYRDSQITTTFVKSPRLRFVAYTHLRQSCLALLVQTILFGAGLVTLFLPSPVLLIGNLPHEWLIQADLRNIGMIVISLLTTLKAYFNWADQHYLLQFTDFDLSLHAAIADVKQHAESAFHEANTVNLKLATMSAHIEEVQKSTDHSMEVQGHDIKKIDVTSKETLVRVTDIQEAVKDEVK